MSVLAKEVYFRGYRCFTTDWSGFVELKPVNVIIGRNNVGKSRLLDLVSLMCQTDLSNAPFDLRLVTALEENLLRRTFSESIQSGPMPGNHWSANGVHYIGARAEWIQSQGRTTALTVTPESTSNLHNPKVIEHHRSRISGLLEKAHTEFSGMVFRKLVAERNISQEYAAQNLSLGEDGSGATNIIRKYLHSSDPEFDRDLVQKQLLTALNNIFGPDGQFNEITVQQHDSIQVKPENHPWEVFLHEDQKGLVPLSSSGSSLKTVILVLLNIIVEPTRIGKPLDRLVFAFEELENNLHPRLLRSLLRYIEAIATQTGTHIFLTTHSSITLDYFSSADHSQIIGITHDRTCARAIKIQAHFDKVNVIAELGAKPSDILQANGILWVEGPSDRIYLNRWIQLFSDGELLEGRHYQCAFYGGSLLADVQFTSPDQQSDGLANLLALNNNFVIICDSDRVEDEAELKPRAKRIVQEVGKVPHGYCWVTAAKEIENYLPVEALSQAFERSGLPAPMQYEYFFPTVAAGSSSYVEKNLARTNMDKINLAEKTIPHMTRESLGDRFDLAVKIEEIVKRIVDWNK